jgi:hypothetical protein
MLSGILRKRANLEGDRIEMPYLKPYLLTDIAFGLSKSSLTFDNVICIVWWFLTLGELLKNTDARDPQVL